MSFLAPMALALAGLMPLVILLYFLKLKRREQLIASTYLWKKAIEDLRVNSPFQKLRKNLLLWLQLAILALLIAGLARPALNASLRGGNRYVCLLDTSASMTARDVKPDRISVAKAEALRLVSDMSRDDQMMLMTFDAKPAVVVPFTGVKSRLRDAIRGVEARETPTDFAAAVELVGALAQGLPNVRLYVLSDGGFEIDERQEAPAVELTYVKIGAGSENVGITALDARRSIEVWDQPQIFVRLENFGAFDVDTRADLYLNDQLFDAKSVTIPAKDSAALVFADPNLKEGLVRVALEREDDLAADNQAWLVLVEPRLVRTLIVTAGNYFLELAIQKDPLCDPVFMEPDEFDGQLAAGTLSLSDYDMVIFDRHQPSSLPAGSYVFFGALPPLDAFSSQAIVEQPVVIDWDTTHPVNQYVNFANLFIEQAMHLVGPSDAHTLVETEAGPLILWWSSPTQRILVVGFDLFASRWPLRVGFPVFLANAVRHLGGVRLSGEEAAAAAGRTISFSARTEAERVALTLPGGARAEVPVSDGRVSFAETYTCGPYVFDVPDDGPRTFVVNLLDPRESDIAPREDVPWQQGAVAGTARALKENREIWPWLAFIGLCVLMTEWYIYNRRAYL